VVVVRIVFILVGWFWLGVLGVEPSGVSFQFFFESFEGAREHPVFAVTEWLEVSHRCSAVDCCPGVSHGEYLYLFYAVLTDGVASIWPYFFIGVGCHGCDFIERRA
jgi:hypothetical protein